MVVLVLKSRRMVPGPESNSNLAVPTSSMTEHELRSSEGTQVPDPRTVTVISGFSLDISDYLFKYEHCRWPEKFIPTPEAHKPPEGGLFTRKEPLKKRITNIE